jgi:hypothetical protein
LRAAPPEFAADSMIKLSPHPEIDDKWKVEILEEAFRIAFDAQYPYKMKHLSESHAETRTGYKSMAFDLKMDRLSLQLRAILNLIRLDQKKARSLWSEMRKLKLPALRCEETLLYDIADYYRTMTEMARSAYTREEMKIGEEIHFVDSHIINIASPAEVAEAAFTIMDLKTTPLQFNTLVETYSRALENIAIDNRSFWFDADRLSATALTLAAACEGRWFPADFFLSRYRDYLAEQLRAPRCSDNLANDGKPARPPKFVMDLNAALERYDYIPKITNDDIKPRKVERAAWFYPYWTTRRARRLFEKVQVLRFGQPPKQTAVVKSEKPPRPLSFEARQTSEWQYQLSDFLRDMAEWKPEHEASEADYFHQKCRLFNELVELSPNSLMRMRMTDEYMAFLEQNRFERESFIEWFLHVSDLLRRIRVMEEEEKNLALDALRHSNDHVLRLCIKLMPAIEAALQASR